MPEMTPRAFSFNSPHGACPECQGLGAMIDFDPQRDRARRDRSRSPTARSRRGRAATAKLVREALQALSRDFGIDLDVPFAQAAAASRARSCCSACSGEGQFEGLLPNLRRRYEEGSWAEQEELEPYRSLRPCPACRGQRLKPQSLSVQGEGPDDLRLREPADRRGARGVRRPAADRPRSDHRRADPARRFRSGCGS